MRLQIYTEDSYCEAYEVLAEKATEHWHNQRGSNLCDFNIDAKATTMRPSEMADNFFHLIRNARRDRFGCVGFVIDREGPGAGQRKVEIQIIKNKFEDFCEEWSARLDQLNLSSVFLVNTIVCLESWLLADQNGLIDYMRERRGGVNDITLHNRRTDLPHDTPQDHEDGINNIFRRLVGEEYPRYQKSEAGRIAVHVDPHRGSANNRSLECFCEMAPCRTNGCEHTQDG